MTGAESRDSRRGQSSDPRLAEKTPSGGDTFSVFAKIRGWNTVMLGIPPLIRGFRGKETRLEPALRGTGVGIGFFSQDTKE
jgi:hypothetical protein